MKYVVNSVQDKLVNVTFTFDSEELTVNLNNMPTDDADALTAMLSAYALTYIASRSVTVAPEVLALVGIEQIAKVPALIGTEQATEVPA